MQIEVMVPKEIISVGYKPFATAYGYDVQDTFILFGDIENS